MILPYGHQSIQENDLTVYFYKAYIKKLRSCGAFRRLLWLYQKEEKHEKTIRVFIHPVYF
ncbi:hypothetical protein EMIT074MI3_20437 [Bacillus licheniformis]